ncbi:hypothetical protein ACFV4K_29085 [Nocardia sp. NPDC059764]|uniref:hypothetical protein n=1 Tax=Nocardia sp. NPDC059764 TaxID=3346939 RepID=UPI0036548F26
MRPLRVPITLAVSAAASCVLAAAPATAQPQFTPEPGGVIKVESAPGEWWKCGLYSIDPPTARGLPPVVDYPPGSWSPPGGDPAVQAPDFTTGPAYAQFTPGATVLADCVSEYLPVFWVQILHADE